MANFRLKKKYEDSRSEDDSSDINVSLVPPIDSLPEIPNSEEVSNNDKKKKNEFSKYFYRVSNHSELNRIGTSYYKDFKSGIKSFAIASTDYINAQQRTILGLASFFDHKDELSILIISNKLQDGCFSEIISHSELENESLNSLDGQTYDFYRFHHHFDFLSFDQIVAFVDGENPSQEYEDAIDEVIGKYDIVFWDVPSLDIIQENSQYFFPITMKFERLTIVVSQAVTSARDIDIVKKFFLNYGVSLKGLLMDTSSVEKSSGHDGKKRKKLWGIW